jgi:tetratricopeptide (TPR) repeat protein
VPVERHVWAQGFEGDLRDTLGLQNRVARAIAEQIRATVSQQEQAALQNSKVVNPEAYEAYLKGRYFWNKRTGDGLKKAIDYFDRALEKDLNFAKAYSGLADSYALSGDWEYGILSPQDAFPRAKAAATKALALDRQSRHSSTDANVALIYVRLGDGDQAMIWLDKAYRARFNPSILLRPAFDPLRSDARFQDLLRRIGLPLVTGPDLLH